MDVNQQSHSFKNTTWELGTSMEEDHNHILLDQLPFEALIWPNFQSPQTCSSPSTPIPNSSLFTDQIMENHNQKKAEDQEEEEEEEPEEEELGSMKEMMYKIAAMQPVDIDPTTIRKPKRRNVRISNDPQSVAARHRRERISERIRILQRLVPGGTKMDTASMLDEAIRYVKFLKRLIRKLQSNHHPPPPPPPSGIGLTAGDWRFAPSSALGSTASFSVEPPDRASQVVEAPVILHAFKHKVIRD